MKLQIEKANPKRKKRGRSVSFDDYASASGQCFIRRAVKNLCDTMVNSSLMQGISSSALIEYEMSPWQQALLTVNVIVAFILLFCAVLCVLDILRRTSGTGDKGL